jgi:hypothetical protein
MILGTHLTHVLLFSQHAIFLPLANVAAEGDQTGINDAMYAIARLIAGFVGGTVALALVVEGYHYMFTDSASRGSHFKRTLAYILGGATLVILGAKIAPLIVSALSGTANQ